MNTLNEKVAVARRRSKSGMSPSSKPSKTTLAVVIRRQTIDEQHRFKAATDALLMELVRQQIGRGSQ